MPALTDPPDPSRISVRLAATPAELHAAQRLRYRVFYEEGGAIADSAAVTEQRDFDAFDDTTEHLIVVDAALAAAGLDCGVVGNYRLLRSDTPQARPRFYSARAYDLSRLQDSDARLLELGRSCVRQDYRSRPVLQLLWKALAEYVADHRVDVMFGCASFRGTDVDAIAEPLAYLHYHHLAQPAMRPHAVGVNRVAMDRMHANEIVPARALRGMEPLIRGYLRLGAGVGLGASIDLQFNSIDVCIVLPTAHLTSKYARRYARDSQSRLRAPSARAEAVDGLA